MSKLLGIVKYIEYVVIGLVACVLVLLITPTMVGYETKTIISPSMQPTINVGDVVIVDTERKPSIGEVIVFTPEKTKQTEVTVTHRLVRKEITESGLMLVTKGDNNNVEDTKITPEQVQGVVKTVLPKVGYFHLYKIQWVIGVISILIILTGLEAFLIRNERKEDEETK